MRFKSIKKAIDDLKQAKGPTLSPDISFGQRIIGSIGVIIDEAEAAGIDGVASVLGAVIAHNSFTRRQALAYCRRVYPSRYANIIRDLLDLYTGHDPERHRWMVQQDGIYAILT